MIGMRKLVLWMICLLAVTACTKTTVLRPTVPVDRTEANERLALGNATVRTAAGGVYELYNVQFSEDSLSGVAQGGTGASHFGLEQVIEVQTDKSRVEGGLTGALIGAGIGTLLGYAAHGSRGDAYYSLDRAEYTGLMAASGAIWGVLIGAIKGSRTKYRIAG